MRYLSSLLRLLITLGIAALAGVLAVELWRSYMFTPWTRDGRVLAQVIDIAPEVAGPIVSVPVADNQFVHRGDTLFVIDPIRFQLAIRQAQAQVDAARQQENLHQSDVRRRQGLTGIVSAEEVERVQNTAAVSGANLAGALAALDLAKLNLERSVLHAPTDGWVTHLRLRVGDYANIGHPEIAVIDSHSFWVEGYFEETKLPGIAPGSPARIRLMGFDPILTGHVTAIGRGISDPDDLVNPRGLPTVNPVFTWVRLAQRIPVHIEIDTVPPGVHLASGLTASVSVGSTEGEPGLIMPRGKLLNWLRDHL
jgi:multidrug resistance efflux pump